MPELRIVDPVFATYLIHKGCELDDIEPSGWKDEPKYYLFDESVREADHESAFLGCGMPKEMVSWRDFITGINRLFKVEDLKLRQVSDRTETTGWELIKGEKFFVTTDQAIAAFILSHADNKGITVSSVRQIKGGYKFIFSDPNNWAESAITKMLEGGNYVDTWWEMKCSYKLATSIRRKYKRAPTGL